MNHERPLCYISEAITAAVYDITQMLVSIMMCAMPFLSTNLTLKAERLVRGKTSCYSSIRHRFDVSRLDQHLSCLQIWASPWAHWRLESS